MAGRLDGEVALITGAARGQGEAEARLFAREGAQVVLTDIRDELVQKVAREIGPQATYVHLDVSQEAEWQKAVDATVKTYGKLTILVNNAGIGLSEDRGIEQTSLEIWHKTLSVNLTGVFLGMKYAIPAMRQAGHGSIVNISSIAGIIGGGMLPAYHASKGGVRILTKTAAIQYAKENIRVNSVHPGGVDTEILSPFGGEWKQAMTRAHPMGRIASADEIAYGVLYLASKEASFVTGAELVIDGGFIAQ
jgi:NAD(P)-dependent dehydrogenase (short-subunit alcohol dehydrogenase family)